MRIHRHNAFSLLELLLCVVIVGILVSLGLPSYQSSLTRTRRVEAKVLLFQCANILESQFAQSHNYQDASTDLPHISENGFYRMHIVILTPSHYLLHAIPQKNQARFDTGCATMGLDETGQVSTTGTEKTTNCWSFT